MNDRRRAGLAEDVTRAFEVVRHHRPIVHVVANGVRGDSRVIKSALTSIDEGLPTLVVGASLGPDHEFFEAEGVPVLLVPFASADSSEKARLRSREARSWRRREVAIAGWRAARAARARQVRRTGRVLRDALAGGFSDGWTVPRPSWLQMNVAFADVLDEIEPRLVHVHDTVPLPAAIAHAAGQRLRRRSVSIVYDAHECVPELEKSFPDSPFYTALSSIEAGFIHDASRVVTVSPQIAQLLKRVYALPVKPLIVGNGPYRQRDLDAPDLRSTIGLAPDVPLAVYSGWLAPERGLDTVLRAMPSLPDLHLALVVNSESRELLAVLRLAKSLDVLDRVHTAPYVLPSQVTQYLSSADIGLVPLKQGGHLDLSLPTKFREYLHAGLPLVVSDRSAMAAEVNRTKVGRVFKAGNVGGLSLQVGRVLADPERYTKRITDELLDEHSWETHANRLRPLYARMARDTDPVELEFVANAFRGVAAKTTAPPMVTDTEPTESSTGDTDKRWQNGSARHYGVKLGIGRANSAGQAYAWANAVSTHLDLPAESFAPLRAICHPPDVPVRRSFTVQQGAAELGRVASQYTYLLIDGFQSLFGPVMQGDLEREIDMLRSHLFGIGLAAHGSEVRDPDAHLAMVEGSYFAHAEVAWVNLLREISSRNRAIADRFDGPVFVSTPDLLSDLPTAHWLPVVVDRERWSEVPVAQLGGQLRVLHQPSRSDPPIKGTDVIDPVLNQLAAEGLIDYIRMEDVVDAADMPGLVAKCDVVVDQIRTGSYGVAAVEAMMAGRVVVGSLSQSVKKEIGEDVPIIDAPPKDFEDTMRQLVETGRRELASVGSASRDYAVHWHDGRKSSRVILETLLESAP